MTNEKEERKREKERKKRKVKEKRVIHRKRVNVEMQPAGNDWTQRSQKQPAIELSDQFATEKSISGRPDQAGPVQSSPMMGGLII